MLLRSLGLCAPLAAGALYFDGAFDSGYARKVGKSPDQAIAALADMGQPAPPFRQ